MNLTSKMLDVSKIDTGLPEEEKRRIHRRTAIVSLGSKWLLHKDNAPKRGQYNPTTGSKVS